mmetsp:Transcript_30992/g.62897  ORF Transcript_30992/g.62897 Transcript_30992/m.62897 type:complete len:212 (-) Transcript_30992:229-864(-)
MSVADENTSLTKLLITARPPGTPRKFFDEAALFAIPSHVLDGYLILLGREQGVGPSPLPSSFLTLSSAFLAVEAAATSALHPIPKAVGNLSDVLELRYQAVVHGNVLNACFGKDVTGRSRVKAFLLEVGSADVKMQPLIVRAYQEVFAAAKAVAIGMPFDGNSGGGPDALGALVCCGVGVTPKALRQNTALIYIEDAGIAPLLNAYEPNAT